ncbi:MAG: hypothetical protein Rhob2KO_53040 [Rhodopirellula baltica]
MRSWNDTIDAGDYIVLLDRADQAAAVIHAGRWAIRLNVGDDETVGSEITANTKT